MQRNKSTRDAQSQLIKEVLAQFDIETQVNRIALRCFNDLLRSNKQAFDVIAESEKKITEFETRLCKTQGFAQSIQKNVSSKIEIANNLNRRLQNFSVEFYANIKEEQELIQTIRKDYDSLVASTQKNTYELRSLVDSIKKNNDIVEGIAARVQSQIGNFSFKINQSELKSQKQLIEIRVQCQKMQQGLTEARTHFLSKSSQFEDISKDIQLYKFQKDNINRRITQIMKEVQIKLNKSDFNQMRLQFDSRMITDQQNNIRIFSQLRSSIKEEKQSRKQDVKNIISQNSMRWKEQDKTNSHLHTKFTEIREQLLDKIFKIQSKQENFQVLIKKEIQTISKKEDNDMKWVRQQIKKQSSKTEQNITKICDIEKFMQQRYQQIIELNSTLNSVGQRVEDMIRQNQQRRKEMSRLESSQNQNKIGQSVNSLGDVMTQLQDQIFQNNKSIASLIGEIASLKAINQNVRNQIKQQQKDLLSVINTQKQSTQSKFTQINRHINDVSIQIMNNLHTVELQSKKYVDGLIDSIKTKLQFLDRVNQQVQELQKAFQDQMKQTKAINLSISEKMQKANAGMTKFKSDLSLRVDAIVNEQQRRSLQAKQLVKQVEDIRKQLGNITEGISICLSIIISRQFLEDTEGVKDIKISSLLEGWVLEIDEKQIKYRGQTLHRRKLAVAYLNFFILHSDKIKGTLIQSGKDIYFRMLQESQQIFTTRKKGFTKKIGSQLPKLHL